MQNKDYPRLLDCPFCGGEATMQAPNMHRMTCITCKECWMSSGYGTPEEVAAKWNRRAQPANEPLTLDELRKMRGQVVDIPESEVWYSGRGTVLDDGVYDPKDQDGYWPFEYYGEWLAYDHKPGGEQDA